MNGPEIRTPRLSLRPLHAGDAPALYEYRQDPRVFRFQSFEPRSLHDVALFIESIQANTFDSPGTWSQLAVCLNGSGVLVGDVGLHFLGDDGRQVEIGFTVAPVFQGRGFGTEAVNGVLSFLFHSLGKHRVVASVDPRNGPSIALLKRVGMRQEAHFRRSLWFKGAWADDLVFAALGSEWAERANG